MLKKRFFSIVFLLFSLVSVHSFSMQSIVNGTYNAAMQTWQDFDSGKLILLGIGILTLGGAFLFGKYAESQANRNNEMIQRMLKDFSHNNIIIEKLNRETENREFNSFLSAEFTGDLKFEPNAQILVAKYFDTKLKCSTIIGFIVFHSKDTLGNIDYLGVARAWRQKGCAQKLIAAVKDDFLKCGIEKVKVIINSTNSKMRSLVEKCAFVEEDGKFLYCYRK